MPTIFFFLILSISLIIIRLFSSFSFQIIPHCCVEIQQSISVLTLYPATLLNSFINTNSYFFLMAEFDFENKHVLVQLIAWWEMTSCFFNKHASAVPMLHWPVTQGKSHWVGSSARRRGALSVRSKHWTRSKTHVASFPLVFKTAWFILTYSFHSLPASVIAV